MPDIALLEEIIGYHFKKRELLDQALHHSSYAYAIGHPEYSNERLEFLGDAALNMYVSEKIFALYPAAAEGKLTRLRASLVNTQSLAAIARKMGLPDFLMSSSLEKETRSSSHLFSDCFEALLGAVYLDGGLEAIHHVLEKVLDFSQATDQQDYKTRLQEWVQKNHNALPEYAVVKEEGPEHEKKFEVMVKIKGEEKGRGDGRNKKEAEQDAACAALKELQIL